MKEFDIPKTNKPDQKSTPALSKRRIVGVAAGAALALFGGEQTASGQTSSNASPAKIEMAARTPHQAAVEIVKTTDTKLERIMSQAERLGAARAKFTTEKQSVSGGVKRVVYTIAVPKATAHGTKYDRLILGVVAGQPLPYWTEINLGVSKPLGAPSEAIGDQTILQRGSYTETSHGPYYVAGTAHGRYLLQESSSNNSQSKTYLVTSSPKDPPILASKASGIKAAPTLKPAPAAEAQGQINQLLTTANEILAARDLISKP